MHLTNTETHSEPLNALKSTKILTSSVTLFPVPGRLEMGNSFGGGGVGEKMEKELTEV